MRKQIIVLSVGLALAACVPFEAQPEPPPSTTPNPARGLQAIPTPEASPSPLPTPTLYPTGIPDDWFDAPRDWATRPDPSLEGRGYLFVFATTPAAHALVSPTSRRRRTPCDATWVCRVTPRALRWTSDGVTWHAEEPA